jgi:hypothetical protein
VPNVINTCIKRHGAWGMGHGARGVGREEIGSGYRAQGTGENGMMSETLLTV